MMSNICREAEAAWFSSQHFFDIRRYGSVGLGAVNSSTPSNTVCWDARSLRGGGGSP